MGLLSFSRRAADFTDMPTPTLESIGLKDFALPASMSGAQVNTYTSLQHLAVWSCQNIIADGVSTLPVDVFKSNADGSRTAVSDDKRFRWIRQPNPNQTASEFWQRYVLSLLQDGNAFIAPVMNGSRVESLHILPPSQVQIVPGPNSENTYQFRGIEYKRGEIIHVPLFSVPGVARGLSPIDIARDAIGLGLTQQEYSARFFSQGASLGGVIEHPSMPKPGEVKALREMFRKTHSGVKNSHALGILTGGAQYKPVTLSPEQSQLLESRRFSRTEIAMIYRVPAYMVDPTVTSTWGTGIEEMGRAFVDNVLMPYIVRAEQMITAYLLPDGYFAKFNVTARLRSRTKERYESYRAAIDAGFMTPNQAAALEDMPRLPEDFGDKYYRPLNFYPVDNAPETWGKGEPAKADETAQEPTQQDEAKPDDPANGDNTKVEKTNGE